MESFRKERFNEAEEITRLNMGLGTNVRLPSVFSADLSKIYRKFLYVRDFEIVAWPVQRRFAYRAKFQKLFNDRGEIRSKGLCNNYQEGGSKTRGGTQGKLTALGRGGNM